MVTDRRPDSFVCTVCGLAAPMATTAECNWCDQRYHLNQRNDVEGKDCGEVWIDEMYLALQFACNNCLRGGMAHQPGARVEAPVGRAGRRRFRKRT